MQELTFKKWFRGCEGQYVIIGGTACDILMAKEGLDFRATKDIDLVLIIEAVDVNFGRKFGITSNKQDTNIAIKVRGPAVLSI